jgi:hypothetical protein
LLGLVVAQAVNSPCDFNQKMVLQHDVNCFEIVPPSCVPRAAAQRRVWQKQ